MPKCITRFAPSPTSQPNAEGKYAGLHLGGARTALFNYALAKSNAGSMYLRIEDTDKKRSSIESEKAMIDDLQWLGIEYAIKPDVYRQSDNITRYRNIIDAIRSLNPDLVYEQDGAIWMRPNLKKSVAFFDEVKGLIRCQDKDRKPFVLMKSDGMPSFYLAMALDDISMNVTHVVRGEEHIPSTFKQIEILKSLSYNLPIFAHIPLIMGENGKKLSKRDTSSPVLIQDFREQGIPPEAVIEYMSFLGYRKDNADITKNFTLNKISSGNATFSYKNLLATSGKVINKMTNAKFVESIQQIADKIGTHSKKEHNLSNSQLNDFANLFKPRSKRLKHSCITSSFIFRSPEEYDIELVINNIKDRHKTKTALENIVTLLNVIDKWESNQIRSTIYYYALENNMKVSDIACAIRIAISNSNESPPVEKCMELIGRTGSIDRLKNFSKVLYAN